MAEQNQGVDLEGLAGVAAAMGVGNPALGAVAGAVVASAIPAADGQTADSKSVDPNAGQTTDIQEAKPLKDLSGDELNAAVSDLAKNASPEVLAAQLDTLSANKKEGLSTYALANISDKLGSSAEASIPYSKVAEQLDLVNGLLADKGCEPQQTVAGMALGGPASSVVATTANVAPGTDHVALTDLGQGNSQQVAISAALGGAAAATPVVLGMGEAQEAAPSR